MIQIIFLIEIFLWIAYIGWGSYQIFLRDFRGPGINRVPDTISVPDTETQLREKRELELLQARTTIEIIGPVLKQLQAQKIEIEKDIRIAGPGSKKHEHLLNRLYTINSRIYTRSKEIEKAYYVLENS